MATDREKSDIVVVITRVTYSKPGPDLLRRIIVKVKDENGVAHVVSDTGDVNVGKRSTFKQGLRNERNSIQDTIDSVTGPLNDEIDFLNEQITDIEAL